MFPKSHCLEVIAIFKTLIVNNKNNYSGEMKISLCVLIGDCL